MDAQTRDKIVSPAGRPSTAPVQPVDERDSYSVTALSDVIDRSVHAAAARFTLGLSPAALGAA